MEYSTPVLLFLLLAAVIAIGVMIYRYASLKARLPVLVREEFDLWKARSEFEIQDRVRAQFHEWRDREAEKILAIAEKESLITAHNLFKGWCENELEAVRREQREIAGREAGNQLIEWKQQQEKLIRQDAILRSQAVTAGKVTEHLVPHLPNFNYNPKDVRFIGSPIDFIIFDGLNNEEENHVREVVFVEIKTGMSALTKRERLVRDAVRAGRVKWVEWNANRELEQSGGNLFE